MKRGGSGVNGSRVAASKGVAFSKSPVLAVRLPTWRSRVVLFVMFVAFAALAGRARWLQAVSTQFLQSQGKSRYERSMELPATRGKITDRNGQVLASSLPVRAVWAFPDVVLTSPPEKLRALAKLLDMPEAEMRKKLDSTSSGRSRWTSSTRSRSSISRDWSSGRNTSAFIRRAK